MTAVRFRGDGRGPDGRLFPYLADERLTEAVNMALVLRRPLLLKGPPGCGKTMLAEAVAHELGWVLHEWHVKSTSRAKDGLYTIDVLRRLHDVHLGEERARSLRPYLTWHALGKAIRGDGGRAVVLIDEIDKADIDFPNDLLRELDRMQFTIEELPDSDVTEDFARDYAAPPDRHPLILITSNDEKELPDAFLRRCLFHWIDFPSPERLAQIVEINLPGVDLDPGLVSAAIAKLEEVRGLDGLRKQPATSELIDWLRMLHDAQMAPASLDVSVADLPYDQALYKHQGDLSRARRASGMPAAE